VHVQYPDDEYQLVKANITHNDSYINRFFVDRQGIVWVSTNRGILIYPNLGFYSYDQFSGLNENEVSSVEFFDDENVLLGSNTGWQIMRNQQFVHSQYFEESRYKPVRIQQTTKDGESIVAAATNHGLIRIYKDGRSKRLYDGNTHTVVKYQGEIYFVNYQHFELWKLDKNEKALKVKDSFSFPKMYVRKLVSGKDGNLYGVGARGIVDFTNDLMVYSPINQELINREMNVFDLAEYPDQSFLIATMSGLMKFDPQSGDLQHQYMDFDFPVYSLFKTQNDQIEVKR
jgi:ligand-binding sensor domain-containing protein